MPVSTTGTNDRGHFLINRFYCPNPFYYFAFIKRHLISFHIHCGLSYEATTHDQIQHFIYSLRHVRNIIGIIPASSAQTLKCSARENNDYKFSNISWAPF